MDLENRLVVAKKEEEGVGGIGILGLRDANYCSWNGFTMRSCFVTLRTVSRYLQCSMTIGEKNYVCVYVYLGPHVVQWEKKSVLGEITIKSKLKK